MPRAGIAPKQAVYTLGLLHAELAGKLLANKREAIRLRNPEAGYRLAGGYPCRPVETKRCYVVGSGAPTQWQLAEAAN
jgi:hypothetical protein